MRNLNNIGEVLKEQGRSQTWLGKQIGRTRTSVNAICANRTQPSLALLHDIAVVLGVSPCKLLGNGLPMEKEKRE